MRATDVALAVSLLSPDEAEHADRFARAPDQRRYVLTRAALRLVLARHADAPAAALTFAYGEAGKPRLVDRPEVTFNVSHSGDVAVIGVSRGHELGVDVEHPTRSRRAQKIADRYFHPSEAARLAELEPEQAMRGFLRCWTTKEAVAKALGCGVARHLRTVCVDADPDRPLALLAAPHRAPARWSLHELSLPAGRAAVAVAIAAPDVPLTSVSGIDVTAGARSGGSRVTRSTARA
jgi:4'-phosphopantetheinyl transferase